MLSLWPDWLKAALFPGCSFRGPEFGKQPNVCEAEVRAEGLMSNAEQIKQEDSGLSALQHRCQSPAWGESRGGPGKPQALRAWEGGRARARLQSSPLSLVTRLAVSAEVSAHRWASSQQGTRAWLKPGEPPSPAAAPHAPRGVSTSV